MNLLILLKSYNKLVKLCFATPAFKAQNNATVSETISYTWVISYKKDSDERRQLWNVRM